MANFFYATYTVVATGKKEHAEAQLWFLGGRRNEEGHALLADLRAKQAAGEIVSLCVDYES